MGVRKVVAWSPGVVLVGLLAMVPAWAQAPVNAPASSGITLEDATGPACGSAASGAGVPGLTLGETPPPTCRLRGVLLATAASEPSLGVRLTEVPGGSPERDRLLVELNTERIAMNWLAVKVLGAWTLANIAVGTVGYFVADDRTWRAFHQMNALINVPVLGTAVVGALLLAAQDPGRLTLAESLRRGVMLERGLFVGVTLDVLVATFGAFLWERGRRIDSGQLTGWGRSLVFQGALLLLFDSGLLLLNARYDTRLMMLLSPDARDGAGLAVRMRF
jgi:hypothetical protein